MALENLMAILNNLVLALIDRLDFQTVPDARRRFSAKPPAYDLFCLICVLHSLLLWPRPILRLCRY